ncbi:MAG: cupin domain-containing protein [Acidimicrobiales bacterium]
MAARLGRGDGTADEAAAVRLPASRGMSARSWGNAPGDTYGSHSHGYHKVLYCVSGSITFHTSEGDLTLGHGDRLDVEPGTLHSATVGPAGVRCVEGGLPPV